MLQIDHVYEFLYQNLFKDFEVWYLPGGVPKIENVNIKDILVFKSAQTNNKIFLYDQEPFIPSIVDNYVDIFTWHRKLPINELSSMITNNVLPYDIKLSELEKNYVLDNIHDLNRNEIQILVTSEYSAEVDQYLQHNNLKKMYYFFHGFAASDWYRGYYALNYNKLIVKPYNYDFISFNRIITDDRSYRIYFVSLLKEAGLLDMGLVSFNVADNLFDDWRDEVSDANTKLSQHARQHAEKHLINVDKLVIDHHKIHGSASANIPRTIGSYIAPEFPKPVGIDSFWHIVTETVFYYDKLHLTEKIFKPIVSKQPFILLAAPGNLAYLKSYGFKTFDSVIDESYDNILDNDLRTEAVVRQLHWYCKLTPDEKTDIIRQLEPIINYNFHHFYGEFRHIITKELLDNTKTLFHSIGYDDSHINYDNIYHVLTQ